MDMEPDSASRSIMLHSVMSGDIHKATKLSRTKLNFVTDFGHVGSDSLSDWHIVFCGDLTKSRWSMAVRNPVSANQQPGHQHLTL
jgi:hypothetical protein